MSENDFAFYDAHELSDFVEDSTVDYSYLKKKMSEVASFRRDYEGCIDLLDEINAVIGSYPLKHRSLSDYFRDKDMILCMKALLEAIVSELPETGSRGGAVFVKNGNVVKENLYYRDYLTVTGNGKTEYIRVSSVPFKQSVFENYLNRITEENI